MIGIINPSQLLMGSHITQLYTGFNVATLHRRQKRNKLEDLKVHVSCGVLVVNLYAPVTFPAFQCGLFPTGSLSV